MKIKNLFILAVSCLAFFSCQQEYSEEVFSCDPEVDIWVKKNLKEIRVMTRSELMELNEDYQKASFHVMSPNQRMTVWKEKLQEVLELNWSTEEREHIISLLTLFSEHVDWFEDERSEELLEQIDIETYKWIDYAEEKFKWDHNTIYAIAGTLNPIEKKDSKVSVLVPHSSNVRLKSSSEQPCDCRIDNPISERNCLRFLMTCEKSNCRDTSWGCGAGFMRGCTGGCK